jgi:hypothetical protein
MIKLLCITRLRQQDVVWKMARPELCLTPELENTILRKVQSDRLFVWSRFLERGLVSYNIAFVFLIYS